MYKKRRKRIKRKIPLKKEGKSTGIIPVLIVIALISLFSETMRSIPVGAFSDNFSNISYKVRDKETIIFMPYKTNSPIKNHFQISSPLSSDHEDDFFLIGDLNDVSYLSKKYQENLIKELNVTFSSSQLSLYEIIFK